MLERYFVKGVMFNWLAPENVDPALNFNPAVVPSQRPTARMTFQGVAPNKEAVDSKLQLSALDRMRFKDAKRHPAEVAHLTSKGFAPNQTFPHVWVDYHLGSTAYVLSQGSDVLTGFMSGCPIITWSSAQGRKVGHVGTVEAQPQANTNVKNATLQELAREPGSNATGFNPAAAWEAGEVNQLAAKAAVGLTRYMNSMSKVMALVTSDQKFFSIALWKAGERTWIVLGCKSVASRSAVDIINRT